MLVSWVPDRPVTCTEHGPLSSGPLSHHDAGVLALTHLRDAHGLDQAAAERAISQVRAHQDHPAAPAVTVQLTQAQARYLSILAAQDLRGDAERGWTPETSTVIRDIHDPAWQALQPACGWDDEP